MIKNKMKKIMEIMMKTFLATIMIGFLFLIGCSDENSLVAPENNQASAPNWITLPQRSGSSVETEFSVTNQINGSLGGILEINQTYNSGPIVVKVKAKLQFPANCFPGTENITMLVDNVSGTVTYSPSMNFNIPAILDLEFMGLDLTGINPADINFAYQDPDGSFDFVEYDKLKVQMNNGGLELKNAQIPHFSRYGYCR